MSKNGFRIFDADTHVGPAMEALDPYLTPVERTKLAAWEPYRHMNVKENFSKGSTSYLKGARSYRRRLGDAGVEEKQLTGYNAANLGVKMKRTPSPRVDHDPAARIEEMDLEGVDVNLMLPSGWFGTWTTTDDVALEMGMYRAYHRWMNDYCSKYPERLGAVLLVSARDIEGSLEEIRRYSKSRWAWGILPYAPYGMPLDHPQLEPLWGAAQEHDLVVTLHTFTSMPPYAPGGQDNWDNMFLQRSAAHPWCGMRNMAALIGGGVMDRYPKLRVGTLEAGHGWLPFWTARIDEHAETVKSAIPTLRQKPSEYVMGGRYFQSIEMHEGAKITDSVFDLVGDGVLMYGSDYPHPESHFPESVEIVMSWQMSEERKRKLLWDNAVKFYARSGHRT
jgi:predicted TIM-barrel fold metal-dependent hydrolase